MCIEALSTPFPCLRTHIHYEEDLGSSPTAMRVALSIVSLALGVFSATVFLATADPFVLGITLVLCITAIALWPNRTDGRGPPPRFNHVQTVFNTTLPSRPVVYPAAIPYTYSAWGGPVFQPSPQYPTVPTYPQPDSRIHVGDGGRAPAPVIRAPIPDSSFSGESRIPVGHRGGEAPHYHEQVSPRGQPCVGIPQGVVQPQPRIPSAPPYVPSPTISSREERRIPVGGGGTLEPIASNTQGDERVPVGRDRRRE